MKLILAGILFFALQVSAKAAPEIHTEITFGDKVSKFRVYERAGVQYFTYNDTYGKSRDGQLSKSGYEFIARKANEIFKFSSNDMNFCRRQFMSVKTVLNGKPVERKGCIGSSSPVAKKMAELANTEQLLLQSP